LAKDGGVARIQPRGRDTVLYVLAVTGGEFSVLSPICTHRGCTVDVQGTRLVCPCHGSTFDRTGAVLEGPADSPLRRFDARVERGTTGNGAANSVLIIQLGAQG
jgi:Rieske Fe-S protein